MSADDFRRCLEEGDIRGVRRLWGTAFPRLPQPESDAAAEISLHYARTAAFSIAFRLRAYSHAWLVERDLPSGLPDPLRPRAERMYPRIVEGVGISVMSMSESAAPLAEALEKAMSDAVAEVYADYGAHPDVALVKKRMAEARARTLRG